MTPETYGALLIGLLTGGAGGYAVAMFKVRLDRARRSWKRRV